MCQKKKVSCRNQLIILLISSSTNSSASSINEVCELPSSHKLDLGLSARIFLFCVVANGLHAIDLRFRTLMRVGALAVIWSLWLCRNNNFFDVKKYSLLLVIYECTSLLLLWSSLQRMEN
jgi:hypothetical protein